MIVLTGRGAFAEAFQKVCTAEVVSARELSKKDFENKIAQAKVIVHNASTIQADKLSNYIEDNFDFTRYLIEVLEAKNPSAHLIYISSMSILDTQSAENYAHPSAMDNYAFSKFISECLCLKSSLRFVSCVRFSTLFYGDATRDGLSRLIADAAQTKRITLLNNGVATRDFIPLPIAAQYVQKITNLNTPTHKSYNLACGTATSFSEIANILKKEVPDLIIENKESTTLPVLSTFSSKDVQDLGLIPFNLNQVIKAYLLTLSPPK